MHENRLPFPFGTVKQFWFDISYMDAAKNTAKRSTARSCSGNLPSEFRTQRDEQLVGFWSFAASAPLTTWVDGYLRTITE